MSRQRRHGKMSTFGNSESYERLSLAITLSTERLMKSTVMDPDSVRFVCRGISYFLRSHHIDHALAVHLSSSVFLISMGNIPYKITIHALMPYASLMHTHTQGVYARTRVENVTIYLIEDRTGIDEGECACYVWYRMR